MNYKDDESELAYTRMETTAHDDQPKFEDALGSILVHSEQNHSGQDESDPFLVTFERSGDIDPRKWSKWYLHYINFVASFLILYPLFCSGIQAAFSPQIVAELKLNPWMVTLALSHFEICFCITSPLWGWLSDQHGRKRLLLACFNGVALFLMGCALSQSAAVMVFCRLMAGLFAAGIPPITMAIIADKSDLMVSEQGVGALALQLILPSPGVGISSMIVTSKLGWRGIFWVFAIVAGGLGALIALTFPETHRPTILRNHARHLRKQMHDHRYHAPTELAREDGRSVASLLALSIHESVLILSEIYLAFILACLNIYYGAAGIASQTYHSTALMILAPLMVTMSQIVGLNLYQGLLIPRFHRPRVLRQYSPECIPPETRLIFAVCSTPLLAIGFFWFGWTVFPNVGVGAPISAGVVVGLFSSPLYAVIIIYISDVYESVCGTAFGWTFALNNVFLAVFPIISERMFRDLGLHWASTLSGCITIATIPIPMLLMRYGSAMRAGSKYARQ